VGRSEQTNRLPRNRARVNGGGTGRRNLTELIGVGKRGGGGGPLQRGKSTKRGGGQEFTSLSPGVKLSMKCGHAPRVKEKPKENQGEEDGPGRKKRQIF